MGIMVQIRNVPDALHRRLKSRVALAGVSLSDYLLREIRQVAEQPTIEELRARLQSQPEITLSVIVVNASALLEALSETGVSYIFANFGSDRSTADTTPTAYT